jgi:hypothetical protein
METMAKIRRDFWPSDSLPIWVSCSLPLIPKLPVTPTPGIVSTIHKLVG